MDEGSWQTASADDRGPRSFDVPRPSAPTALTLLAVREGDISAAVPLPACDAPPCPPETTTPADLLLVLPIADVTAHSLGQGWSFAMDP